MDRSEEEPGRNRHPAVAQQARRRHGAPRHQRRARPDHSIGVLAACDAAACSMPRAGST